MKKAESTLKGKKAAISKPQSNQEQTQEESASPLGLVQCLVLWLTRRDARRASSSPSKPGDSVAKKPRARSQLGTKRTNYGRKTKG